MSAEIRNTQINLDGLLEVLGKNLYSTPVVVVRELVQNAHDACVRRRVESGWDGRPEIRITADDARNTLTIADNGSGLTREEIIDFLATIGSGYTRVLRNRTGDENAVGYFGLGFLTAYVVSDAVEFHTTSYQEDTKTWRFASKGGQQYSIDAADSQETGSRVVLHLKEVFSDLSDYEFLEQVIRKYCCLLPIDIYLDDDEEPVNRIDIPWRMEPAGHSPLRLKKAGLEFAELFDHSFEPIVTMPIPHDDKIRVNGLLWIQDGSYYASSDNRVTSIFIRSMHITDECKELLPEWAGFVGCVVDCSSLTPTASRESVQQDDEFNRLKTYIKKVLIDAVVAIARERGAVWRRLQSRHNQALLGASISDPALFDAMHLELTLPTSEGELTAQEIGQRGGDTRLRVAMEQAGGYEYLIARSLGIPVIYGYRFAVMQFCRELSRSGKYSISTLGSKDSKDTLFPECALGDTEKQVFERYFQLDNTRLVISQFQPDCLPTVKVLDQDALLKKRIDSDELDRHVGSATLRMARKFTDAMEVEHEAYLYLNYANPVIKGFCDLPEEKKKMMSGVLLAMTDLLANQSTDARSNIAVMESLSDNLLKLGSGDS